MCYTMKKFLSALMVMAITLSLISMPVMADSGIKVALDGELVSFDVPPQIINERTMVPVRAIFEAVGATVGWEQKTQTVTSKRGETNIRLTIDEPVIYVNGIAKELDTPAMIIDERTLVPARAISEAYGLYVDWVQQTQTVVLTTKEPSVLKAVPGATYALKIYDSLLKNDIIRKGTYDSEGENYYITLPVENSVCKLVYDIKGDRVVFSKINRENIAGKDYDINQTISIERAKSKVMAEATIESYFGKPKMTLEYANGKWMRISDTFSGQLKSDTYNLLMKDVDLFASYISAYSDVELSDFGVEYTSIATPEVSQGQGTVVAPDQEHTLGVFDAMLMNDIIRKGAYDFVAFEYFINLSNEDSTCRISYNVKEDAVKFSSISTKNGYNVDKTICIDRDDNKIWTKIVDKSHYNSPELILEFADKRWKVEKTTFTENQEEAYDMLMQNIKLFNWYLSSYTDVRLENFGIK